MYNAFRRDSSIRYGWFFFVMAFQFAISVFFSVGIPGTGAAGIWVAIATTQNDPEAGIVVFTAAGMWMLHSLLCFWIIARSISYYRSTGGVSARLEPPDLVGFAWRPSILLRPVGPPSPVCLPALRRRVGSHPPPPVVTTSRWRRCSAKPRAKLSQLRRPTSKCKTRPKKPQQTRPRTLCLAPRRRRFACGMGPGSDVFGCRRGHPLALRRRLSGPPGHCEVLFLFTT